MKDLSDIIRQAQEMQSRLADAQKQIDDLVVEGVAGGGLVTVRLRGKGDLDGVRLDPSLLTPDDGEILEDLLKAAHADARRKLEAAQAETMQKAAGGLGGLLPGFKLPF